MPFRVKMLLVQMPMAAPSECFLRLTDFMHRHNFPAKMRWTLALRDFFNLGIVTL